MCLRRTLCKAARDVEDDILASGCPVPREQQPIQELKQLQVGIAILLMVIFRRTP